jgi:hypothetical protein
MGKKSRATPTTRRFLETGKQFHHSFRCYSQAIPGFLANGEIMEPDPVQ